MINNLYILFLLNFNTNTNQPFIFPFCQRAVSSPLLPTFSSSVFVPSKGLATTLPKGREESTFQKTAANRVENRL